MIVGHVVAGPLDTPIRMPLKGMSVYTTAYSENSSGTGVRLMSRVETLF